MGELLTPAGVAAITGLLAAVSAAFWKLIERADKRAAERDAATNRRIAQLEQKIAVLEKREDLYLRRIYQLEGHMRAHAIAPPDMHGWPP